MLSTADDVAIGRSKSTKVGRRGLPGNLLSRFLIRSIYSKIAYLFWCVVVKILGAAAAKDYSFDKCVEIGRALNEQLVSIGSTLDHCHVPGRQNHDLTPADVVIIGAGIHNEPVRYTLPLYST